MRYQSDGTGTRSGITTYRTHAEQLDEERVIRASHRRHHHVNQRDHRVRGRGISEYTDHGPHEAPCWPEDEHNCGCECEIQRDDDTEPCKRELLGVWRRDNTAGNAMYCVALDNGESWRSCQAGKKECQANELKEAIQSNEGSTMTRSFLILITYTRYSCTIHERWSRLMRGVILTRNASFKRVATCPSTLIVISVLMGTPGTSPANSWPDALNRIAMDTADMDSPKMVTPSISMTAVYGNNARRP